MANLLSPDSKVMTGINKVVDMIWMSVLWCIFCLPWVWIFMALSTIAAFGGDPDGFIEAYRSAFGTDPSSNAEVISLMVGETYYILMIEMLAKSVLIGPSTAALYYTMVKVVRRERGYATKTFFHGFKVNFKTGAPASVLFVIFGILMIVDFRYVDVIHADNPTFSDILNIALIVVCIFVLLILVWIFPILSRFTISLKALFKNAMLISIRHFIGSFILGGGIVLIFWLIYRFSGDMASILIIFPFILPAAIALGSSFIIEPVLKRYTGSQNKPVTSSEPAGSGENPEPAEARENPGTAVAESVSGEVSEGEPSASEGTSDEDEENSAVDEWYNE
ncbi:MAG: DUF624 domain-containing protein [Lachnospiraceae bacterium]|nr:DUF624 domain-containing protein [Lachnospiraceae bacterium]